MRNRSKEYFFDYPEFNNIKELVKYTVDKFPNNTSFILKKEVNKEVEYTNITTTDFLNDINALGTAFYDLGLKGKKIAVVSKNRYEWFLTYISTMMGNMITIPLDKGLKEGELESCILRTQPDAIVFGEDMKEAVVNIKANKDVKTDKYIMMDDNEEFISISQLIEKGNKLIEEGNKEYINADIDNDTVGEYCFTSGTSSNSKIVMLSHRNIASNVSALHATEQFFENDVNLAFLPFHHTFGSTGTLFIFSFGAATAFPDGLRYIQKNLKEYKVSVFIGVPLLVESMYKKVEKELEKQKKAKIVKIMRKCTNLVPSLKRKVFKPIIENLGNLRCVISGAAPLDKEVWKAYNELGITILQGYGLTECSPVVAAENFKCQRAGTIGYPMKGVEVKIDNKNELGIGELLVKGPNVMLGYFENEEANAKVFTEDGWFRTGDLAYIDLDGYITIVGREKNVIVLKNGKNIFPEELETLVNKFSLIKDSMVYGMEKDDDLVVSVKVQYDEEVKDSEYKDKSEKEIKDIIWNYIKKVNESLPTYKYIKQLHVTKEEFIRTTTAKIKRYEEIAKLKKEKK